jgi:hypothetical protein
VATGKVVGGILLATDKLLGVEQLTVSSGSDFIDHSRLQIQEHCTRDVLPCTGLTEEGVEGVITASYRLVAWHVTIRLQFRNRGPMSAFPDPEIQTIADPSSGTRRDSISEEKRQ